jgi:hypothetical protein
LHQNELRIDLQNRLDSPCDIVHIRCTGCQQYRFLFGCDPLERLKPVYFSGPDLIDGDISIQPIYRFKIIRR